jgi:DNA-binding transcriptional LysR family regulator
MVRRFILGGLALGLVLWTGAVRAAELEAADKAAIEAVITAQIAAFLRDDGEAAFGLTSPGIQARFGSADGFMAMVRQGYGAVYRPRSFSFIAVKSSGDTVVQILAVVGPDGTQWNALYPMERRPGGGWATGGCVLIPAPGQAI